MRRVIESDKKKQKMVYFQIIFIEYINSKIVKIMFVVVAIGEWFTVSYTIDTLGIAIEIEIKIIKTSLENEFYKIGEF